MKKYLNNLPQEIKDLIVLIGKVSRETKMPAYLVGGFPRDLILGAKDWDLDITVEGDGIKFAENLARRLHSGLIKHERFGTATLILGHRLKVDIATTRKETYPFNACLPVVRAGSLREDLLRRDFTINAMAVSLSEGAGQKLIDIFDGKNDLAAGKIRVLHDLSFKDDPTRILRGIRFQQRYNFKIEPKTLGLLKKAIESGLLDKVNPHRMRDELILMFKEKDPSAIIRKLYVLGGLSFISDKLKPDKLIYNLLKSINKEISWFMQDFPFHGQFDAWLVYFAALLRPLTLAESKKVIRRLGLSKQEEKKILNCRKVNQRFIMRLKSKQIRPAQIFTLLKPLSYEAIILLRSASRDSLFRKHIADFLKIYNCVRLCISGDDLYNLGFLPGPGYQKILNKVLAARLNGKIKNRQEELALIGKLVKLSPRLKPRRNT
ncbi:MAG: CCA tRNA nucleotidyltransferase [Candidatus Omnitrophica bacterium]|nr:CCA tRNA nucleotidyltransferase [Candidatus Omnitrophota bacterium]MDD5690114.1 CCA tRNA nucleotidyltransferase [Candidatus Omnitrophota bacterium]